MDVGAADFMVVFAGALVGLILGLIGGGGSILAVPLLVYVVGVKSPHVAIGTSSVAVALSAFANLIDHARRDHVCWPVAILFATSGVVGAALGSTLGKYTEGQKLLVLFGMLMVAVAASMALRRKGGDKRRVQLDRRNAPWVVGIGVAVGALSGFFGIGGGFLVVPGLITATSMAMIMAVGSSLVSVTAFGLTTGANYALSDLIDWAAGDTFRRWRHCWGTCGRPACNGSRDPEAGAVYRICRGSRHGRGLCRCAGDDEFDGVMPPFGCSAAPKMGVARTSHGTAAGYAFG